MQAHKIFTFQKQMSSDHDSSLNKRRSEKSMQPGFTLNPKDGLNQSNPPGSIEGTIKANKKAEKNADTAKADDPEAKPEVANPGFEYKAMSYNLAISATEDIYKQSRMQGILNKQRHNQPTGGNRLFGDWDLTYEKAKPKRSRF